MAARAGCAYAALAIASDTASDGTVSLAGIARPPSLTHADIHVGHVGERVAAIPHNSWSVAGLRRALSLWREPDPSRRYACFPADASIELTVALDSARLRAGAIEAGLQALVAACVAAGAAVAMVAWLLHRGVVGPTRELLASMRAFRVDPTRSAVLDAEGIGLYPDDEAARLANELAALQRDLKTALARNARLAGLGTVVSKMSHDLRNRLAPALLIAERLQSAADQGNRALGDRLTERIESALRLLRESLEFVSAMPVAVSPTPVAIADLARAVGAAAGLDGLIVEARIAPERRIMADADKLSRVLDNLFRNAAQAGATRVIVDIVEDERAVLRVADNGPGIPDHVRERLFQPFCPSTRVDGSGLGLAIVADLMGAMDGSARLLSSGPAGTTFELSFARAKPETRAEARAEAAWA